MFTAIRNLFHTFMFYILMSAYLYHCQRFFFFNKYFFLRVISENFENTFKKYKVKSQKISRNISDISEMYFRKFPYISRNTTDILGKYFVKFRELFSKYFVMKSFRKISKIILIVLKNFAKYGEILSKFLRNNLIIFKRKIGKFRELLCRISRNISLCFEKYSYSCSAC